MALIGQRFGEKIMELQLSDLRKVSPESRSIIMININQYLLNVRKILCHYVIKFKIIQTIEDVTLVAKWLSAVVLHYSPTPEPV
jgi:hypothetical protein